MQRAPAQMARYMVALSDDLFSAALTGVAAVPKLTAPLTYGLKWMALAVVCHGALHLTGSVGFIHSGWMDSSGCIWLGVEG